LLVPERDLPKTAVVEWVTKLIGELASPA
jgi:hypothetical protein